MVENHCTDILSPREFLVHYSVKFWSVNVKESIEKRGQLAVRKVSFRTEEDDVVDQEIAQDVKKAEQQRRHSETWREKNIDHVRAVARESSKKRRPKSS
jgi:hypothetical protein